jgi:hypothetical protein
LNARFIAWKKDCPLNIKLPHWERLKTYWSKLEIERKVEQMSIARNKLKNMGNVGQMGKTRKKAKLLLVD